MNAQDWNEPELEAFKIEWDKSQASKFCSIRSGFIQTEWLADNREYHYKNLNALCYDSPNEYREINALPIYDGISIPLRSIRDTHYENGRLFGKQWSAE